jgi:hypothetical protein
MNLLTMKKILLYNFPFLSYVFACFLRTIKKIKNKKSDILPWLPEDHRKGSQTLEKAALFYLHCISS